MVKTLLALLIFSSVCLSQNPLQKGNSIVTVGASTDSIKSDNSREEWMWSQIQRQGKRIAELEKSRDSLKAEIAALKKE